MSADDIIDSWVDSHGWIAVEYIDACGEIQILWKNPHHGE